MRVIVIHGWDGYPEEGWFPWLKKELEKKKFDVIVPKMPTSIPVMKKWVPCLSKIVGKPDENIYLIGHSAGCITILRYLEALKKNEKIGGVILVAGFSDDLGFKELKNYFESPINWLDIKKHCNKFIAIISDNDKYVPVKHGSIFKEKLNANLIVEKNKGHFSGSEGTLEVSSVLKSVLKISKKRKVK